MNILVEVEYILNSIFTFLGVFAPILACILIVIESIFPILPLALFITINCYYLGSIFGFVLSYLLTCIGCYLSFILCRSKLKYHYDNMLDKKEHKYLKRLMKICNSIKIEGLVLLIAIPFTPAFLINIAAGLSNMSKKKFIISILIGKIFLVLFWGFIGTNLIESIRNPKILLEIGIMILISFIISKIVNKKYRLE